MPAIVYLIPTILYEGEKNCLPSYLLDAVKQCSIFFVENERTARRNLKLLWKEMVIDDYKWFSIKDLNNATIAEFKNALQQEYTIGIMSEAGCPGVADPGQQLVLIAQEADVHIRPLVGPSSILLALMASGMNGQHFTFNGYLPIEQTEKIKKIKLLESDSRQRGCTEIFIETPYRNNQLLESLIQTCNPKTLLCIAADITAASEFIKTRTIQQWKKHKPELHKKPAIFLMLAK
jgi:16S rRNA (cytidine1402-2'-O)-methyltransferase